MREEDDQKWEIWDDYGEFQRRVRKRSFSSLGNRSELTHVERDIIYRNWLFSYKNEEQGGYTGYEFLPWK